MTALKSTYMGIPLSSPVMPGSSPLADDLDMVRRLEDAGAPAVVMRSLFEEQLLEEDEESGKAVSWARYRTPEAESFFYDSLDFKLGPDSYLEQLRLVKQAVSVPVFASLNGKRLDRCVDYARLIQQAGADGLELNLYNVHTALEEGAGTVEDDTVAMVREVAGELQIPVAVKLSPFWTAQANIASRLVEAGARGLILFNRFYEPDIDIDNLEVTRELRLSERSELLLRLRWLAILRGRVETSLVAGGGVHEPEDVIKALMAGADTVQVVSTLMAHGPDRLTRLSQGLNRWMEEKEYESIEQLRGSMSLAKVEQPAIYERANYMRMIQASWHKSRS